MFANNEDVDEVDVLLPRRRVKCSDVLCPL
jgi:hypothetical protein